MPEKKGTGVGIRSRCNLGKGDRSFGPPNSSDRTTEKGADGAQPTKEGGKEKERGEARHPNSRLSINEVRERKKEAACVSKGKLKKKNVLFPHLIREGKGPLRGFGKSCGVAQSAEKRRKTSGAPGRKLLIRGGPCPFTQ